jgi:hypothetical protein
MSLRVNLFRKRRGEVVETPPLECPHWELAPRWDAADDIGHADRVTHYMCANCGATVTRAEAAARAR